MSNWYGYREQIDWAGLIDPYGWKILFNTYRLMDGVELEQWIRQNRANPIVQDLHDDPGGFFQACWEANDSKTDKNGDMVINIIGVCRVAVICQMVLYDQQHGPEQDNKPKSLRRHWYAWFKQFAQGMATISGKLARNNQGVMAMNDIQWNQRQIVTYGELVDTKKVTYENLWVIDASRMYKLNYETLIRQVMIILCVEKDSLFDDFKGASAAIGARAVVSGKGKNSKAAMEKLLREIGWRTDNTLDEYSFLFITVSDWDYDGEHVIQPTFAEQARRYLSNVYEARVGVMPSQVKELVDDPWRASYQIKIVNPAYQVWADEKGIYNGTCAECGNTQIMIGLEDTRCEQCDEEALFHDEDEEVHGFEVESLRSSDYYRAVAQTVSIVLGWPNIVDGLREKARPDAYQAADRVADDVLKDNGDFQKLQTVLGLTENAISNLRTQMVDRLSERAGELVNETHDEWWSLGKTPDEEEFHDYVVSRGGSEWASVYAPFDLEERIEFLKGELAKDDVVSEVTEMEIPDFEDLADEIRYALE